MMDTKKAFFNRLSSLGSPGFFVVITLLAIPAILPLTRSGFFPTQDFIHVARIYEMDVALKGGQFPVRWVPDLRYGEPLFNFYAPLPYYLGSLIHALGFGFLGVTKILFGLSFILSGITMFMLAKEFFGKLGGLVSAVLYIYAPYHAVDIYVRGAMSEGLALIFFPLIFLASYKLSQNINGKNVVLFSLSLAGLFYTHNIMTILFAPFLIVWLTYLLWMVRSTGLMKHYVFSVLLGLGLAASFLLPAYFEKDLVQSDKMITGYFDFRGHFIEIRQFFSNFWGYGASLWGFDDDMSFQIGLMHWLALGISLLLTVVHYKSWKKTLLLGSLFLGFLFSLFMQHNKSTPIWLSFPILSFTQFPWRFLGISIFFTAFIGGASSIFLRGKWSTLAVILIGGIIVWNLKYFQPESYYLDSTDDDYVSEKVLSKDDKLPKDYLPVWVNIIKDEKILVPYALGGKIEVDSFTKGVSSAQFKIKVVEDSDIETPFTYFPGWKVLVNGLPVQLEETTSLGLVRFKLPKGEYEVKLKFGDTFVRTIANMISVISLLLLGLILVGRRNGMRVIK